MNEEKGRLLVDVLMIDFKIVNALTIAQVDE